MHYYKKNLGDYAKKAGRLSLVQHGVYNILIDACYDREAFPKDRDEAIDWVWASTPDEEAAVDLVLRKFFKKTPEGFIQNRIKDEIDAYHSRCKANSAAATKRASKSTKRETKATKRDETPDSQTQPLTTNHKPITNSKKATQISADWMPDDDLVLSIANKHGCSLKAVRDEAYTFRNYWQGEGKAKKDWKATFRNWCAKDWCPIHHKAGGNLAENKKHFEGKGGVQHGW